MVRRDWIVVFLFGFLTAMLPVRVALLQGGICTPETSQVVLFVSFFLVAAAHAWLSGGPRWGMKTAGAAAGLWWCLEYIGLRSGLVFGEYRYLDVLGSTVGGVPVIIALVWFAMFYGARWTAALCLARPGAMPAFNMPGKAIIISATAALVTLWDMAMDYNQVAEGRWTWVEPGVWFGIPLWNFVGWFGGTVAIQLLLHTHFRRLPPQPFRLVLPVVVFFLAVVSLAITKNLLHGEYLMTAMLTGPLLALWGRTLQVSVRRLQGVRNKTGNGITPHQEQ
ncbi:carotenoid biosynthesis protein [bacterium]|nr:carotenoid biosynthesis protein [candidate division CSSED10-310 bacterium]